MFELPDTIKPILGTDEATLDDKGRCLVSKKKRDRLGEDFVLALGSTGCLTAYPLWSWKRYLSEMLGGEVLNFGREDFTRLVMGTADDELNFDAQGRFVIPKNLRELANLRGPVTLLGAGDRLEIWDPEELAKFYVNEEAYAGARRSSLMRAYIQMTGRVQ